jgi:hypothetical protein
MSSRSGDTREPPAGGARFRRRRRAACGGILPEFERLSRALAGVRANARNTAPYHEKIPKWRDSC